MDCWNQNPHRTLAARESGEHKCWLLLSRKALQEEGGMDTALAES